MFSLVIKDLIYAFCSTVYEAGTSDDDIVDRSNYWGMFVTLFVFGLVTGFKQFVRDPILCWSPAQFEKKRWRVFVNEYCWVHTMYEVPWDTPLPEREAERYSNDISFYRWSTIFFISLALMYRLPKTIWKEVKHFSGIDLGKIVEMTLETENMGPADREKHLKYVAFYLHRWITTYSAIPTSNTKLRKLRRALENVFFCYGKRRSHYLVIIYLFTKLLYLVNVIFQFVVISAFLRVNYWTFGADFIGRFLANGEWEDSYNFPRVGMCDVKVRQMQNTQTYTIQCALALNIFLEKMFLALWFLMILSLLANTYSCLKWSYQLLSQKKRTEFMTKYTGMFSSGNACDVNIENSSKLHTRKQSKMKEFETKSTDIISSGSVEEVVTERSLKLLTRKYLKADGVFVLKIVEANTSHLLSVDLIRQIWLQYVVCCLGCPKLTEPVTELPLN